MLYKTYQENSLYIISIFLRMTPKLIPPAPTCSQTSRFPHPPSLPGALEAEHWAFHSQQAGRLPQAALPPACQLLHEHPLAHPHPLTWDDPAPPTLKTDAESDHFCRSQGHHPGFLQEPPNRSVCSAPSPSKPCRGSLLAQDKRPVRVYVALHSCRPRLPLLPSDPRPCPPPLCLHSSTGVSSPLGVFASAVPSSWTTLLAGQSLPPMDLSLNVTGSKKSSLASPYYNNKTTVPPISTAPPPLLHSIYHPLVSSVFAAPLTIIRLHVNRDFTVWVNASTQKSAQNIVGAPETLAGSVNELCMEGKVQVCL